MTDDGRLAGFRVISRRKLLGLGLGATGLFAVGGAGGLLALRGAAPEVPGLKVLSAHEHRTLRALFDTIVPTGGAFEPGAATFDLARTFDGFLEGEPAANVGDLKSALVLVEYGPLLFDRSLATFSNLDAAARAKHWEGWEGADALLRRQVALAFRKFALMVFYDRPEGWAAVGYDGPWVRG